MSEEQVDLELRSQFQTMLISEINSYWVKFGAFSVIQVALFTAVGFFVRESTAIGVFASLFICAFAILYSLVCEEIMRKGWDWIGYYSKRLLDFDERAGIPSREAAAPRIPKDRPDARYLNFLRVKFDTDISGSPGSIVFFWLIWFWHGILIISSALLLAAFVC